MLDFFGHVSAPAAAGGADGPLRVLREDADPDEPMDPFVDTSESVKGTASGPAAVCPFLRTMRATNELAAQAFKPDD